MKLALFDFDGTITNKDSFIEFIIFANGKVKTLFGLLALSPFLLIYCIGLIPNWKAKQIVFNYFFGGWKESKFKSVAISFAQIELPRMLKKAALEKIAWHKSNGHKIVIVSASLNCYLVPWCQGHCLELISTEIECKNNILTGRFSTKNCYGVEKADRIRKSYHLEEYEYIYAYGDSKGDLEMLQLADEARFETRFFSDSVLKP